MGIGTWTCPARTSMTCIKRSFQGIHTSGRFETWEGPDHIRLSSLPAVTTRFVEDIDVKDWPQLGL